MQFHRKVFCAWRLEIHAGIGRRGVHAGDLVILVAAHPAIPVGYVRSRIGSTFLILPNGVAAQVSVEHETMVSQLVANRSG